MQPQRILVTSATGKTGSRIAARLTDRGHNVRRGSRRGEPAFDWNDSSTWDACLAGVSSVYINYSPDNRTGSATDTVSAFVDAARRHGIRRLVMLTGRGEAEAQHFERIVLGSAIDATVVRSA